MKCKYITVYDEYATNEQLNIKISIYKYTKYWKPYIGYNVIGSNDILIIEGWQTLKSLLNNYKITNLKNVKLDKRQLRHLKKIINKNNDKIKKEM